MNLKLNNDVARRSLVDLEAAPRKKEVTSIKEERRRTGRYIAILVGISLFLLAIYHAWVRKIPIVASLVVPALIMFVYIGWVLYTASRDKHRMLAREAAAALNMVSPDDDTNAHICQLANHTNTTLLLTSEAVITKEPSKHSLVTSKIWPELSSSLSKDITKQNTNETNFIKPIILVNDTLAKDLDDKHIHLEENAVNYEKFKGFPTRRKFKRKFCRSKRHDVFKRSYSIA